MIQLGVEPDSPVPVFRSGQQTAPRVANALQRDGVRQEKPVQITAFFRRSDIRPRNEQIPFQHAVQIPEKVVVKIPDRRIVGEEFRIGIGRVGIHREKDVGILLNQPSQGLRMFFPEPMSLLRRQVIGVAVAVDEVQPVRLVENLRKSDLPDHASPAQFGQQQIELRGKILISFMCRNRMKAAIPCFIAAILIGVKIIPA